MATGPMPPLHPPPYPSCVQQRPDVVAAATRAGKQAFSEGNRIGKNPYLEEINNNGLRLSVAWVTGWTDAMFDHVRTEAPGSWKPLPTAQELVGDPVNPGARTGRAIDLGD